MSYHSYNPHHHHDSSAKCFKCKKGIYTSYYKDKERSAWSMQETDTVKCNECGHICSSYLHAGDIVVEERAVVAEAIQIPLKDCSGSIDYAIEKFKLILELSKKYFTIFADEDDKDNPILMGFRLEDNSERAERRLGLIAQKLSDEQKANSERQKRYARYVELKEKFNV